MNSGISNIKQNFNQATTSIMNTINQSKKIFITFFVFITLLIVFYLTSENYRTNSLIAKMSIFDSYMNVKNTDFENKDNPEQMYQLSDYYVASSFRSVLGSNQRYDYCSGEILKKILKAGARFIWFDIFNSDFTSYAEPVVSNGLKDGNWKLTLNTVSFEECCKIIATYAFKSGRVNNYHDPLIIALNLNTNNNLHSLNKIKSYLVKYLGNYLLNIQYNYKNVDIGKIKMNKLKGSSIKPARVIIFASDGFVNSELDELINYSWKLKSLKKIDNNSINPNITNINVIKEDPKEIINFNKNNLSIVVPDEDTIITNQYDPKYGFNLGCQFIAMSYQTIDDNLDKYVQKFKNSSFILKPSNLRGADNKNQNLQEIQDDIDSTNKNKSLFSKCSILPE